MLLCSRFKQAPIKETKTEDWRTLGPFVTTTLERPDPPLLFSLPLHVERGVVGELLQKRPRAWSKHDECVLEVQLLVYRAAFNFCVDLPLVLESVSDDKFEEANTLLDTIGVARLTKEEVLAKAFPAFELSGERRTWFARTILPKKCGEAADTLSLLMLPYEGTYPSSWFTGEMANSRFLELEGDDEDSTRELSIVLAQGLVQGVVSDGEEIEGLDGLEAWVIGEDEGKPVLASAADVDKCMDGDRTFSIDMGAEGGGEEGEEGEEGADLGSEAADDAEGYGGSEMNSDDDRGSELNESEMAEDDAANEYDDEEGAIDEDFNGSELDDSAMHGDVVGGDSESEAGGEPGADGDDGDGGEEDEEGDGGEEGDFDEGQSGNDDDGEEGEEGGEGGELPDM